MDSYAESSLLPLMVVNLSIVRPTLEVYGSITWCHCARAKLKANLNPEYNIRTERRTQRDEVFKGYEKRGDAITLKAITCRDYATESHPKDALSRYLHVSRATCVRTPGATLRDSDSSPCLR